MHPVLSRSILPLLAAALLLPASARAQQPTGSVAGVVRDSSGQALAGVEISLPGSAIGTTSAADGRFRIAGLPAGTVTLRARRIGYRLSSIPVVLAPGETKAVVMTLGSAPVQLDTIRVQGVRGGVSFQLHGFYDRRSKGIGRYFTRKELAGSQTDRMSDALRRLMPGLRIGQVGASPRTSVRLRDSRCPPLVWLDGAPATAGEFDIDVIPTSTVSAVEVYSGPATVPVEFRVPRGLDACGVIVIWSRNDYSESVESRARGLEKSRREAAARADTGRIYHADEVDEAAKVDDEETYAPEYPDSLLAFSVAGRVVAEFVVEPTGLVNERSITMISASHPDLAQAVRVALLASRFRPAKLNGKAVRQVVMMPFDFSPERVRGDSADSGGSGS